MADIVERLTFWTQVYPEDMPKEEGHLYIEARDEILRLRTCLKYAGLYDHCVKYLKEKENDRLGKI
jgi:hypothetical protein